MERFSKLGRVLFVVAIALFAIQYLVYAAGAGAVPGPPWTPERQLWVWLTGGALLIASLGLLAPRIARWSAMLLAGAFFIQVLFYIPRLIANPRNPGPWTSGAEVLAISGAALLLAGTHRPYESHPVARVGVNNWLTQLGRFLFALPLIVFGIQHFLYARFIAGLVPAWIPGRLFWAYFVGVAFIAAAVSIAARKKAPLGAALLGTMFLLWVVIVHSPRIAASPRNGNEWTSGFVALAMSGGGFIVAGVAAIQDT